MNDGERRIASYGERNVTFGLPDPINDKIDAIVDSVREVGGKTTRKEVVGMLIANAVTDGQIIDQQLREFRLATLESIYPQPSSDPAP